MQLPLEHPLLRAWPTPQACALSGNRTSDPLVHRLVTNPLSHSSKGQSSHFKGNKFPSPHKDSQYPLKSHSSFPPPLALGNHQSLFWLYSILGFHINGSIQYATFYVWFLSLSILFWGSFVLQHISIFHSSSWLNNILLCVYIVCIIKEHNTTRKFKDLIGFIKWFTNQSVSHLATGRLCWWVVQKVRFFTGRKRMGLRH